MIALHFMLSLLYIIFLNLIRESEGGENIGGNIKCKEKSDRGNYTSEGEIKETQECHSHIKR